MEQARRKVLAAWWYANRLHIAAATGNGRVEKRVFGLKIYAILQIAGKKAKSEKQAHK